MSVTPIILILCGVWGNGNVVTHPQVVSDQTVEEVNIVFAQSAEVLELVDRGVL